MPAVIEVDDNANGSTVTLAPSQALVIRLSENPTTGYRWAVESSPGMRLDVDKFSPIGTGVGAGGSRSLQWSAEAPGIHRITLVLQRPWGPSTETTKHFTLTVVSS